MPGLTGHRGALVGSVLPAGIAGTSYLFTAAGGSGSSFTFPAPATRAVGGVMVAEIFCDTSVAGGTLWDVTLANANWTDSGAGQWASGGIRKGRQVYRIADGTSNDDLIITKTGGTATGVRGIMIAFRGYTATETPNRLGSPGFATAGASPVTGNAPVSANSLTPAGLYVGALVSDLGTHPLSIASNTLAGLSGALLHETINPGGTDPYLELWKIPILTPPGNQFPTPVKTYQAVAASGTVLPWSWGAVVVP